MAKRNSGNGKKKKPTKRSTRQSKSKDAAIFDIDLDEDLKRIPLREAAKSRYLNYSMSVITSRALPDVRDGLKPVQRRILYLSLIHI